MPYASLQRPSAVQTLDYSWLIITKASWNEKVESVSNANVRTVVSDGPDEMTCNIRLNDNTGSFISD